MNPTLLELGVVHYVLILTRVTGFVAALPHFGGPAVPRSIKAGLIFALANFWFLSHGALAPEHLRQVSPLNHWFVFTLAVFCEAIMGLTLGYLFDLLLTPFRIAGEYVGQEMGFTLAVISNPFLGRQQSVMGQIFDMIGAVAFFSLDLHHVVMASFHGLLAKRPPGGMFQPPPPRETIELIVAAEEFGLQFAAPVAGCLFITSLVLAMMTRTSPQLNLMTVGFALKLVVGLAGTFLLLPEMGPSIAGIFSRYLRMIHQFY